MTFFHDILAALRLHRLAFYMVKSENKAKYKRTFLGPWWVILSMGFSSLGLGILWTFLWNLPAEQIIPNVTVGFLVWNLILICITDGVEVFTNKADTIKNIDLPLSYHIVELISRHFSNFIQSLIIVVCIWLYFIPGELSQVPFFLFGLFITSINIFLLVFILSFLNCRYRDIQPLVTSIMPMLFFLSPVLFRIQQAAEVAWLMYLNPLTYLITIVRDPLIGKPVELSFYLTSISFIPVLYASAAILHKTKVKKLSFWL